MNPAVISSSDPSLPLAEIQAGLEPLIAITKAGMQATNAIIVARMQSEIDLIPTLAGHLIAAGGKRMRPMLTLAGASLAGASQNQMDNAARLAASVEFIHTATLLHDDVIDESDMRRGNKTASAIWGNEASVLVGDFLFARAFELMVETGEITVLGRLAAAAARITEGEIAQMLLAGNPGAARADYFRVIEAKTAELFAAAAETGAMIGGADKALSDDMRSYGMALGIAFQITDDALDYAASSDDMGKAVGDDFKEGKITLPVILAWQDGDEAERSFWRKCLQEGEIGDSDLQEALAILEKHNAITRSLAEARQHAEAAAALAQTWPFLSNGTAEALVAAARFAAERTL